MIALAELLRLDSESIYEADTPRLSALSIHSVQLDLEAATTN